jgi:hypothetical protein
MYISILSLIQLKKTSLKSPIEEEEEEKKNQS